MDTTLSQMQGPHCTQSCFYSARIHYIPVQAVRAGGRAVRHTYKVLQTNSLQGLNGIHLHILHFNFRVFRDNADWDDIGTEFC